MNNKGPRIEPWGTPILFSVKLEKTQLTLTRCFLHSRYDFIKLKGTPRMPFKLSLSNNIVLSIVSNARLKSKKTALEIFLLFKDS